MSEEPYAELFCMTLRCNAIHRYHMPALHVSAYWDGTTTLSFFCMTCKQQSEFTIPFDLGLRLARQGAPATIVSAAAEVHLEQPAAPVPPIQPHDVGIMERSTLEHFTECARRELLR